jgi:hypothetical protein
MQIKDPLLEPFFIDVDDTQFTVRELCVTKEGNNIGSTYEQTVGYFVDFQAVCRKLAHIKVSREEEVVTLKEFANKYITILQQLLNISDEQLLQFPKRSTRVQEEIISVPESVEGSPSE